MTENIQCMNCANPARDVCHKCGYCHRRGCCCCYGGGDNYSNATHMTELPPITRPALNPRPDKPDKNPAE